MRLHSEDKAKMDKALDEVLVACASLPPEAKLAAVIGWAYGYKRCYRDLLSKDLPEEQIEYIDDLYKEKRIEFERECADVA